MQVHYNECFARKWVEQLSPLEWRDVVSLRFADVPRRLVEPAGCLLDPDVVEGWARRIADGLPIPPPVASLTERGTYYLHDGNHRFRAISRCDQDTIRICVVFPPKGYFFDRKSAASYTTYELRRKSLPRETWFGAFVLCGVLLICVLLAAPAMLFSAMTVAGAVLMARWGGTIAGIIWVGGAAVAMMLLVLAPTGSLRVGEWSEMVQLCTVSVLAVGVVSIVARTRRSLNQRVPRGSVLRGG